MQFLPQIDPIKSNSIRSNPWMNPIRVQLWARCVVTLWFLCNISQTTILKGHCCWSPCKMPLNEWVLNGVETRKKTFFLLVESQSYQCLNFRFGVWTSALCSTPHQIMIPRRSVLNSQTASPMLVNCHKRMEENRTHWLPAALSQFKHWYNHLPLSSKPWVISCPITTPIPP